MKSSSPARRQPRPSSRRAGSSLACSSFAGGWKASRHLWSPRAPSASPRSRSDSRLLDGEDVAVGIPEPGGADVAERGDAVLRLEVRRVVLLERDAALAERGHRRVDVVDAEAGQRAATLTGRDTLIRDERSFPDRKLGLAVLR